MIQFPFFAIPENEDEPQEEVPNEIQHLVGVSLCITNVQDINYGALDYRYTAES